MVSFIFFCKINGALVWGLAYCKYRFRLVFASQTQSLSTWPHLFNTQCPPAPTFRRSWWASNSGGQLHCNASLSRGQWFLPMWKCKYQGVNCHSHLLAMTVGCLPDCPAQPGAWQPWPARAKHKAIPPVPEVYLETDKGNFTNVLLITKMPSKFWFWSINIYQEAFEKQ